MVVFPMATLVGLIILGCLIGGVILFIYTLSQHVVQGQARVCRRCRTDNPPHARFCACCGQILA